MTAVVEAVVVEVETAVVTEEETICEFSEDVETFLPPQPVSRHNAADIIMVYLSFIFIPF